MTPFLKCCVGTLFTLALTGCQTFDTWQVKKIQDRKQDQYAKVYCSGAPNCEFERLNQTVIVDAKTGRLSREAIQQRLVRLNAKRLSDANALYLSVPPKDYELVIRFYPVSADKAETLHVFQKLQAPHRYDFVMYRQRTTQKRSLLNASVPDPLCVDVRKNGKMIRRFCKPFNAVTGIAEFVEKKI